MREDVLRVEEKRRSHPRGAGEEREGYGDKFHGEPESLLLDLGKSLKQGYDYADDRSHDDRYERKAQHQHKAHLRVIEYLCVAHSIYPLTKPWIRSVQPLTMTNSRSLNGSEIVTGETIIMPIASSMLETIMSIAMNGRYTRNPI